MTGRLRSALRWGLVSAVVLALIVIPFGIWGAAVERWVMMFVEGDHSAWVIASVVSGLLCLDVFLPIPSSVVSVASGAGLGVIYGTAASAAGMTAGCLLGYAVGAKLGRPGLQRLVEPPEVERFEAFAGRFGDAAIVVARGVPVLAEASVLLAGAARVPFRRFALSCLGANLVVSAIYGTVGDLAADTGRHELGILAALVVPGLAIVGSRIYARRIATD